jgi:hypothetical protein
LITACREFVLDHETLDEQLMVGDDVEEAMVPVPERVVLEAKVWHRYGSASDTIQDIRVRIRSESDNKNGYLNPYQYPTLTETNYPTPILSESVII